jgi:hypothetical protein
MCGCGTVPQLVAPNPPEVVGREAAGLRAVERADFERF